MPISHKKKCIFVHIQRTGGSSIRSHLRLQNKLETLPDRHYHAPQLRDLYGEDTWDSYFTFSSIRNPFERLVSCFFHMRARAIVEDENKFYRIVDNFKQLVKNKRCEDLLPNCMVDFLKDEKGNIIVDYIIRYENYKEDYKKVLEKIGKVKNELRLYNSSRYLDYKTLYNYTYKDYYDQEMIDIVGDYYKEDLKTFNYDF